MKTRQQNSLRASMLQIMGSIAVAATLTVLFASSFRASSTPGGQFIASDQSSDRTDATTPNQPQVTWQVQSDYIGAQGGSISQVRSLRGLALAPNQASIFDGFIQGSTSGGIRKVNSSILAIAGSDSVVIGNGMGFGAGVNPNGNYATNPYYGVGVLATRQTGGGASAFNQPKGVATDDRGFVYATLNSGTTTVSIQPWAIYDSSLNIVGGPFTSTAPVNSQLSGISAQNHACDYYVYIARNNNSAQIERWKVTNPASPVLDTTWGGGTGKINLRNRADWSNAECNGLEADFDGTLYVTGGLTGTVGSKRDSVFKIPAAAGISGNLASGTVATVAGAMDVAIFQDRLVVSQYLSTASTVAVLKKSDLSLVDTLVTGFAHTNAAADSGYSGITVSNDGKIYVVDQLYSLPSNAYTPPATAFNPSPQSFGAVNMNFDRVLVSSPLAPDPNATPGTAITKVADATSVGAGSQMGFKVTLTNDNTGPANGLSFTDNLPAGQDVNWTIDGGNTDTGWSISGSPPNQSLAYSPTILACGVSTMAHVVSNTTINSCGTYNNTASFTTANHGSGQASASISVVCYTIAVSASPPEGGSVSGGGTYGAGSSVTVTATPNNCYAFVNWTENGNPVSTDASYSFTVSADRTLVANFALINYTITANAGSGGSASGGGMYGCGSTATVMATPDSCHTFVNWTENGNPVSTDASYSFTVSGNRTLVANFAPITYTITANAGPGGSASGGGQYECGSTATVMAKPDNCHTFANWTENGNVVSNNAEYSFTVNSNRNLVANFTTIVYTINASAGPNGSISPSGMVLVNCGGSQMFQVMPNTGYHISDVLVDGSSVGPVSSYTFNNVTANHTISASFAINTYTINASAGPGGSVSPSGMVSVNYGGSQTFSITPNSCYHIADVTVDGNSVGAVSSYTFNNVTANHTISASFAINIYTISTSVSPSGSGNANGGGDYACGEQVSLTAMANPGYLFVNWTENGNPVSSSNPYTFTASSNRTLVANFIPVSGQVTVDGTNCAQFSSGNAQTLDTVNYSVGSNSKTKDVKPGKLMYWVKVSAPAGSNTFIVNQAITTGNFNTQFKLDGGSNVFKSGDCKATGGVNFKQSATNAMTSTITVKFNAPTAGVYYIEIKFQTGNLSDDPAPAPGTTVHYDFSTSGVAGSTSGVNFVKR